MLKSGLRLATTDVAGVLRARVSSIKFPCVQQSRMANIEKGNIFETKEVIHTSICCSERVNIVLATSARFRNS